MQVRKEESGLLVVSLERGESVRESIEEACRVHRVLGAQIWAIGAVENPDLGFYHLGEKRYQHSDDRPETKLEGVFELVSFLGNISTLPGKDDTPFMHAHISIGDADYHVKGGHLFDAKVGVVVEVTIMPFSPLRRMQIPEIGLPRWCPIKELAAQNEDAT